MTKTTQLVEVQPIGGSMWTVRGGDLNTTIGADRTRDGGVYLWQGHYEPSDGEAAGVDPDDEESWDISSPDFAETLADYFALPPGTLIRIEGAEYTV